MGGLGHVLVAMVGLFAGIVIASGLLALLIGLNIIPRYAGITHTADKIILYENCAMAGAVMGNLATVYPWQWGLGSWLPGLFGLFGGIFLGGWLLALAEIVNIFPIMNRRLKLQQGMPWVILCLAVGKTLWSLLYYYKGW